MRKLGEARSGGGGGDGSELRHRRCDGLAPRGARDEARPRRPARGQAEGPALSLDLALGNSGRKFQHQQGAKTSLPTEIRGQLPKCERFVNRNRYSRGRRASQELAAAMLERFPSLTPPLVLTADLSLPESVDRVSAISASLAAESSLHQKVCERYAWFFDSRSLFAHSSW